MPAESDFGAIFYQPRSSLCRRKAAAVSCDTGDRVKGAVLCKNDFLELYIML